MTKNTKKIIISILLSLLGGVFGFLIAYLGFKSANQYPGEITLALFVAIIPLYFIVIALHEAGHAIAGVWVGFDFKFYVVGPFMWEKEDVKWKFSWNKNVNTAGGLVLCLPTNDHNLRKRFAWFAAGGPLASLATGLLFFVLYMLCKNYAFVGSLWLFVQGVLGLACLLSLFIFFVTALPFHAGGFSSDGARCLRLLSGGRKADFEVLLLKIITSSSSGTMPNALSERELQNALALGTEVGSPTAFYLNLYLYYHYWSVNKLEEAEIYLQKYISCADEVPEGIRNGVWLEGVIFYGLVKPDYEKAIGYWSKYKPAALIAKVLALGAEATVLKLQNESEASEQKFKEAIASQYQAIDKGIGFYLASVFSDVSKNKE
ncbi:MAG: M50 family metallopeptidase [Cyclobacteriaceae bacterium]|nr:M50 family metallopeptidase [Cytophagales bacterium]MCZ8327491.1 M50 family metallopeptidase [Cyclobacteriaceae bacterium]